MENRERHRAREDEFAMTERETMQQVYIRVCRDSGFQLDMHRAAALAAKIVGKHPIDIWCSMPGLDVMAEIAAGTHPAAAQSQPRDPKGER